MTMVFLLALGAFAWGLILGYVWGWHKGVWAAYLEAETRFRAIEETGAPFVVGQRESAREGRQ